MSSWDVIMFALHCMNWSGPNPGIRNLVRRRINDEMIWILMRNMIFLCKQYVINSLKSDRPHTPVFSVAGQPAVSLLILGHLVWIWVNELSSRLMPDVSYSVAAPLERILRGSLDFQLPHCISLVCDGPEVFWGTHCPALWQRLTGLTHSSAETNLCLQERHFFL